jgi:hypothetical protein
MDVKTSIQKPGSVPAGFFVARVGRRSFLVPERGNLADSAAAKR